jgi:hypothetical protein
VAGAGHDAHAELMRSNELYRALLSQEWQPESEEALA